ncbi:MAG: translational GTPase TypA [Anaerolineaceae bacterium]|nr:translational GTPase TypA [Anaerolineaceae bacterium]
MIERKDIRNIAIIAHVDHGKTTLVDAMLKQARVFHAKQKVTERIMDSNDLERERGITILSKNTAIKINDPGTGETVKINIVDTPGHADFGGEVERIMNMVDGVLLLVDSVEGPKAQTKFVLKKALAMGHRCIVVVNKMDRRDADPDDAVNRTFDLFVELGANEQQADFSIVYTNAITGQSSLTTEMGDNLQPLFETILNSIPCPMVDLDAPLQMLVTSLGYDEYRGITAVGKIKAGRIRLGQPLARILRNGDIETDNAQYLYVYNNLRKDEVEHAEAGEIIELAGLENIAIGETLADAENPIQLPPIEVEAPTVRMTFGVNTSPLSGIDGKWVTSRKLRERLFRELRNDVALRVEETESAERFAVSGRGELHLGILIENMRREGYEFEVSRPEAIFKEGENGEKLEPYEEVHIETSSETVGTVIEMLGSRKGEMINIVNNPDNSVALTFLVPTRGLLGFRSHFLTATRGEGVINSLFNGYSAFAGPIQSRNVSSLVAWERGTTTTYGLKNAEERGTLFVKAGTDVYEGMVVGESLRPQDVTINVCKKKHLTNMRQSVKDIDVRLSPPKVMSLDETIEYLTDDELLEITPLVYRIRKRVLDTVKRTKIDKKKKELLLEA